MQTSVSASADLAKGHRGSLGFPSDCNSLLTSSVSSATLATSAPHRAGAPACVPLIHDNMTFDARQATKLRDIEKRMETEMKRKKRNFEREMEQMREEFLRLIPCDKSWGSDELIIDPFVLRRRGSTDILNPRKLKTMFTTSSPETDRRFRLRFQVAEFDPQSVQVYADSDKITVRATRLEETHDHTSRDLQGKSRHREYFRKIEKPKDVDHSKLRSRLSSDGILLIQAPLFQQQQDQLKCHKSQPSPSHSFHSAVTEGRAGHSPTELTPTTMKLGVPIFRDEAGGPRRMHLAVEVGAAFKPKEITVQAIKDNRILIKAKHEERTSERLCKNKYSREFELAEKIEPRSLRGGLCGDGRLVVGAFVKVPHGQGAEWGRGAGRVCSSQKGEVYLQLRQHYLLVPVAFETLEPVNASGAQFIDDIERKLRAVTDDSREAAFLWHHFI